MLSELVCEVQSMYLSPVAEGLDGMTGTIGQSL
jgi:hypothetical protein